MRDFLRQVNLKNQQFKCYRSGDESNTLNLTVSISNEFNKGATANEVSLLTELIPVNNSEIIEFYKLHNGIKLYCNGDISGVQFYSIDSLKELNREWKEGFSDYLEDELYDYQKGGLAFGDISQSGNYFVFFDGRVFYDDHDGGDETPLGETFYDFLTKIVTSPADFLYEMGCYTRFSDGKTNGQWIPKEFIADEN